MFCLLVTNPDEEIFADADSNDATISRPVRERGNAQYYPRWAPNSVEISDEEIETVIILLYQTFKEEIMPHLLFALNS